MKTRKALKGRFKLTATGKLKHYRPGRRHILTKKTAKRKRQLKGTPLLSPGFTRTYKELLQVK